MPWSRNKTSMTNEDSMSSPKMINPLVMASNKNDLEKHQTKKLWEYLCSKNWRIHEYTLREQVQIDERNKEVNPRYERKIK